MQIYLDMDGVLADFVSASITAHGRSDSHDSIATWDYPVEQWGISNADFWCLCQGRRFWAEISPYSHHLDLLDMCEAYADEVFFLTSPSSTAHADCIAGKSDWIAAWFGADYQSKLIPTKHKHLLAASDRVLIDDSTDNIQAWAKAGGVGIGFGQPWNQYDACISNLSAKLAAIQDLLESRPA